MAAVTEHRTPTDQLLDLLVYAPLGLLGEARSLLPELAEKGRIRVGNARMMGQMAVHMGQTEAERRLAQLEQHAKRSLTGYGLLPPDATDRPAADGDADPTPVVRPVEPVADVRPHRSPAARKPPAARKAPERTPSPEAAAADGPPTEAADLAIPDYDSLAASQVVSRLAGLREPELAAVQRYELATRGRKTILGKIAQLQAG